MKLKVCGMRDKDNIIAVSELLPDFIGFIFYGPSPRNASEMLLHTAIESLPKSTSPVAVFVNEDIEVACSILDKFKIKTAQLHGSESIEYCATLKKKGFQVFKVFSIDENANFEAMEAYAEVCDYFLFDTKSPKHGGTGQKFDWKLLEKYSLKKPVLLSGGIGPDDFDQIRETISKHGWIKGLDLNSRFETAPGMKEVIKLKTFFSAFGR